MLTLNSSSCFSSHIPVQLGTNVLDMAMAKISIKELACASDTWQHPYMRTVVTGRVAGTVEVKTNETRSINTPLIITKPIMRPPLDASEERD